MDARTIKSYRAIEKERLDWIDGAVIYGCPRGTATGLSYEKFYGRVFDALTRCLDEIEAAEDDLK